MTDKCIQDYVEMERERCAQLCEVLRAESDRGFLLFCIRTPVMPDETDRWRGRYAEFGSPCDHDDVEDLM